MNAEAALPFDLRQWPCSLLHILPTILLIRQGQFEASYHEESRRLSLLKKHDRFSSVLSPFETLAHPNMQPPIQLWDGRQTLAYHPHENYRSDSSRESWAHDELDEGRRGCRSGQALGSASWWRKRHHREGRQAEIRDGEGQRASVRKSILLGGFSWLIFAGLS